MAGLMLLNPRGRKRKARANPHRKSRKRRSPAQLAAFKRMIAANPRRKSARRAKRRTHAVVHANPIHRTRTRARRRNPIHFMRRRHHARRRRNPFGGGLVGGVTSLLMEAGVMAAGAVAIDFAYGQINSRLPASLQTNANTVGAGDAVKLLATVAIGSFIKIPVVKKAALGALVVQMDGLVKSMLPASVTSGMAGVGYLQPGPTVRGQKWVHGAAVRRGAGVGALLRPGAGAHRATATTMQALLPGGVRSHAMRGVGPVGNVLMDEEQGMSF